MVESTIQNTKVQLQDHHRLLKTPTYCMWWSSVSVLRQVGLRYFEIMKRTTERHINSDKDCARQDLIV